MASKKKASAPKPKRKTERAPSLNERITDFSVSSGKVTWVPKGTTTKSK